MNEKSDLKQQIEDDQFARAQAILDEFREGFTLSLSRLSPGWCSGHLERMVCYEDQPIDIDYILGKWGGKRLRLRLCDPTGKFVGGVDLNVSTFEPKRNGKIIRQDDDWRSIDEPVRVPAPERSSTPAHATNTDLTAIMKALQHQREQDFSAIREMLGQTLQTKETKKTSAGLDDLLEFGKKWKEMQSIFGSFGNTAPVIALPAQAQDQGGLELFGQITELIKAWKTPSTPVSQTGTPRERRITGEAQEPVTQQSLPQVLAAMPADQISAILLTTLGTMSEDKRETVIADFLSKAGIEEEDESDDDEEIDGEADDIPDQSTGRPLSTDEEDDQADR